MAIEFLKKLNYLFEPARLKIGYGGRAGGKTEGMGTALPVLANTKKLRILCCREILKSIAQSSYQTLVGCINTIGLSESFDIQSTKIVSNVTGSEFLFAGLRFNIENIKSLSKIDIACTDEARNISKSSLDKLGPTIRGRHENDPNGMGGPFGLGPELWFFFNPELEDDEIYKRYVVKRHIYAPDFIKDEVDLEDQKFYYKIKESLDNDVKVNLSELEKQRYYSIRNKRYAFVEKINYTDNKFLPPDMRREILLSKQANEDDYLHVWEGHTKIVLDGAIYAEEIKKILKDTPSRRGKVPYDSSRVVHTFWDLGHDDYTSIWFVQQVGIYYNLINFFQDRLKKLPFYIQYLQSLEYNYGYHYLPHDGDNETLASRSPAKILRDAYPGKVKIVPRVAKKVHGIRAARVIFDLCNFDEENTADGWQCLCNYQYKVDDETGVFSREPLHNEYSHGADAFQTFATSLKSETQMKKKEPLTVASGRITPIRTGNTWMGL